MAGDQSLLKRINRMAIVRAVKASPGIFRGQLAEATGLAESTVSVLVNELIDEGWLRAEASPGRRGGAGRRPVGLSLDGSRLGLIGAELGVDYLAVAACDLQGHPLSSRLVDYEHAEPARSVSALAGLVAEAHAQLLEDGRRPLGAGVGLPGMVGTDGVLRIAPRIGWRDVALVPMLQAALAKAGCKGLSVSVLNDANAGALGEYVFGAAAAVDALVYVSLGFGVGAGLVLDDKLQLGHFGLAGEVGHSILRPGGDPCPCGRRGCAETVLSQEVLSRQITGPGHPVLHGHELVRRLEAGDPAVRAAALTAGEHLGLLLHNLVVTIDPAVVVVGGQLSRLPELVEAAQVSLARHAGTSRSHHPEVRVCRFGPSAGAIGAAGHVLQQLLHPLERRPRARAG